MLLIIIPGFGNPHFDEKVKILNRNLRIFEKQKIDYQIKIFQYSSDCSFPTKIINNPNIDIHCEKGILGYFIKTYCSPDDLNIDIYDEVIILLDDVELSPRFKLTKIRNLYKKNNFDILSPSMIPPSKGTWKIMFRNIGNVNGRIVNFLELFCYYMKPNVYRLYYDLISLKNINMYGYDLALYGHLKLKLGILDNINMIHYFWSNNPEFRKKAWDIVRKWKTEEKIKLLNTNEIKVLKYF